MATQSDIIENAVKEALEQIQKHAAAEYAKLNSEPSQKEKVIEAARAAASETLELNKEFTGKPQNIDERLAKHLPDSRIQLIKDGLNIPTFRLEIAKEQDMHLLQFTREGKQFLPERKLASIEDIDWGTAMQYASILVEGILLALSATGISLSPSGEEINEACRETCAAIENSSAMQRALEAFVEAWNAAGDGAAGYWEKAKALFYLLKDSYSAGIFWNVVKIVCSNMSWFDWVWTSAKVTAMIVAAFATDGAALIAEMALSIMSAVDFARKIANINQLSELKKSL
ncbi:hypothetical protein HOLleu_05784 [Holothuria leucospilota]|uniref:Uncharacterized protein n=1 Tax=Holothuria leucospilota TaxID=206669 RepID=A0A9Q1CKK0_HOLLE|nr:hypothetical protein HOLleu_05784 [Holothuria leucospilota]